MTEQSNPQPTNRGRLLVVDDDRTARNALSTLLTEEGYRVDTATDGYKGLGLIEEAHYDIVLTDLRMPLLDGVELIEKARIKSPLTSFLVMTAFGSIQDAVDAMKIGADEFLIKPLNFDRVIEVIEKTRAQQKTSSELAELKKKTLKESGRPTPLLGQSNAVKEALRLAEQIAPSPACVLIQGEPGTGKEELARFIHEKSPRSEEPFHILRCEGYPEKALEARLFGVEEQGDQPAEKGLVELVGKGTLYLDEVAALPPALQVRLLKLIRDKEYSAVNSDDTKNVDLRIIASSQRDLARSVREGSFREDLYYKINIVTIDMPPLRSRKSDLPQLVQRLTDYYSKINRKEILKITQEFLARLEEHSWPGNVKELENVIERAIVLAPSNELGVNCLPKQLGKLGSTTRLLDRDIMIPGSSLSEIEYYAILQTYEACGGKTAETADVLGVSQRKIQYKLREMMEEEVILHGHTSLSQSRLVTQVEKQTRAAQNKRQNNSSNDQDS